MKLSIAAGLFMIATTVASVPMVTPPNFMDGTVAPLYASADVESVNDAYIVVLKNSLDQEKLNQHTNWVQTLASEQRQGMMDNWLRPDSFGIRHVYDMPNLKGYAGRFGREALQFIRRSEDVAFVEKDSLVYTSELQRLSFFLFYTRVVIVGGVMLQQSTLSISAHQSNQDPTFAETDSKDLLQQHDATSCLSPSSSCSTTDTFSSTTSRRSRIGGNDNSVVRAMSPEGRRYLKPVNGIQAKGFARSAQRRSSVLTLGSIERLQHFYAKRDLKVNKVGILGFKNSNNTTTTTSVPEEEDDDLPEPSTPPRPSWLDLDVETDLDVLVGDCFRAIQSTLSAWSMVTTTCSELSDSDPCSDNEGSEYHIASLVHSVSRTIESIRNYTLHRNDLADSALVKLRHAAIQLLSVIREFETHHHGHPITFDGLAKERAAILKYLGVVEEYAFNPPHHIGAPPVTFSPEIKSLMHKSRSTTTTAATVGQSNRPGLPDWLDPTCYVNDNMGRYRALLADNRQSLQGDVPDHELIPDPNESEEAFLEYLADGRILCNAYNNIVKRSRRPFGFINKIHQETSRTFRAIENLRFFSAACKFRFDLMFHPFEPSEIARKTDRGLTALKPIIVAFCECAIAEYRENLEQVGKKRPLPDQSPVSTTVEKKFFASINNHPTTTAFT